MYLHDLQCLRAAFIILVDVAKRGQARLSLTLIFATFWEVS